MNRISRFISLLLVAALLSMCLSGAFAETATETEESYAVLRKLLETFDENPPENQVFENEDAAAEYCAKLYGFIDPAKVNGIFYGGQEEAAGFLLTLHDTLLPDYNYYMDASLETTEMFYVFIWELLHMDSTVQAKSRPAVKGTVKEVFEGISEDGLYAATDLCYEYIGTYEPDIAGSAYTMNTDNERTVNASEEYIKYYEEGYRLFDEGKYAEAIESYKKCLELQENDPLASFEIIEAYIAMRDYESAKSWLAQIAPYLEGNEYKAQWYRRQGYIAIEEMDYQLAYAFYAYSQTFEQSEMAGQEMEYIKYVSPDVQPFTEEEAKAYLEERGI